jgi:PTH1 family peptidyl-tRNA hydrolase
MRFRAAGSSGGHRGVASIIQCLQTTDFPRLRVGIGRPEPGSGVSIPEYVLSPWVSAVPGEHLRTVKTASEVIRLAVEGRFDAAAQLAARRGKGGQVQCQQQSGEDKSV